MYVDATFCLSIHDRWMCVLFLPLALLVAESEEELKSLLMSMKEGDEKADLKLSIKKY